MSMDKPLYIQDADEVARKVVEKVGKKVILGMCLGLGKPNHLANSIFRLAKKDPSIDLSIVTALSLEKPTWSSELEQRFLKPLVERVWGGYVDLEYILAVRRNQLPPNVSVCEFFYKAGAFLGNGHMQQNYISTNYSHAARDFVGLGANAVGQLVARKTIDGADKLSLSCNSDTALDVVRLLDGLRNRGEREYIAIAEVNENLPFMYGDAVVDPSTYDIVMDNPEYSKATLFGAPRESVNDIDFMVGFHASTLIKDGGTLQIGIGSLGDAICYALKLRHQNNDVYNSLIADAGIMEKFGSTVRGVGGTDTFTEGLYGSTEMFVDGFLNLYKAGVMKRKVYDNEPLQKLVADKKITEDVTPKTIEILAKEKVINPKLTQADFTFMQEYGIIKEGLGYREGVIFDEGNSEYSADLTSKDNLKDFIANCLGTKMKKGFWMHAGFFLGPQDFYENLRNMSEEERMGINMTSVLNVNQLYANNPYSSEELKIAQRQHFRSINAGLMVMLSGAVCSDGLENGLVISGVGGQFNFVVMAHELPGARGGIMIRSTRSKGKQVSSNVVYNYGHTTVPRHLRDIIITEYGIADLRGRSDRDVYSALLNVTDSRFQEGLLQRAKQSKKLPPDYQIPERFKNNYPEKIESFLAPFKKDGFFPVFPFGTAFTKEEISLGKSLREFKEKAATGKAKVLPGLIGQTMTSVPASAKPYLERMQLDKPANMQEKLQQKIVIYALQQAGQI